MKQIKKLFTPFEKVNKNVLWILVAGQIIITLFLLQFHVSDLIPTPTDVLHSLLKIVSSADFYDDLFVSMGLTLKAMFYSIVIASLISYLYLIPFFAPISKFITKLRYLTLTGLSFVFLLLLKDASSYKLSLFMFGIIPFFVTSLVSVFGEINKQEIELCKTLKMSNWQTWYEIVIVGRLDQVFEVIRQNFAIAWLMITFVEGQSMSEGGLGTIMIKQQKYLHLPEVFAILLVIFVIGIFSDMVLAYLRQILFPYTSIQTNK